VVWLYSDKLRQDAIGTALSQKAKAIIDDVLGRILRVRHYFLIGESGCGVREVAQEIHRICVDRSPRPSLFYFDCSAVPEDDLHDRFLDNIAAWSEVSAFGPEEDRKWGTRADIESFLKRRGNPRRLAIILDCERPI